MSTPTPRVTVIIPVYNAARFLDEAVASVLEQSESNWECILVNDGSTDRSPQMAKGYALEHDRIVFLQQPNRGVSAARNLGASSAHPESRYLFFLDADDVLEPTALATMCTYLDRHPEVGLLGCQIRRIDENSRPITLKRGMNHRTRWAPGRLGLPRDLPPDVHRTPFVVFYCGTGQGPHALYRRVDFERVGGWDEDLTYGREDTDMFRRMALHSEVHYIPDRLYRYRHHKGGMSRNKTAMTNAAYYLKQKWKSFQPRNRDAQEVLEQARAYYRRTHAPLRCFQTGWRALGDFREHRDTQALWWALRNFAAGTQMFVLGQIERVRASCGGSGTD